MRMRIPVQLVANEHDDERDGHRERPELYPPKEVDQEDFQNAMADEIDAGIHLRIDRDRCSGMAKRVGEPIVGLVRELMRGEYLNQIVDGAKRNEQKEDPACRFQNSIDSLDENRELEKAMQPSSPLRRACHGSDGARRHGEFAAFVFATRRSS